MPHANLIFYQEGIPYTLFERDSAEDYWNKTRDWGKFVFMWDLIELVLRKHLGMLLHWGKDFLLSTLPPNLQARFDETLVDPQYNGAEGISIPHVNGETGQVMAKIAMPGMVRVSRKKMRSFLTSNGDLNISVRLMHLKLTWWSTNNDE